MTFEDEFGETIKEMRAYLNKGNLNMINFTYPDGWTFKLSCPRKDWVKQNLKTKGDWID